MYRMLCVLAAIVLVFCLCIEPFPKVSNGQRVIDVSWPNCQERRYASHSAGIVGATGGLNFRPNPCLSNEITWFPMSQYSLYMNTGNPGRKAISNSPLHCLSQNTQCLAYNYGFNAAIYAMKYAALQNAHSEQWWLDVETENSWSIDTAQNCMVLIGMIDAIKKTLVFPRIGVYSTSYQWRVIMGDWKNKFPVWVASGSTFSKDAELLCSSESFTGGKIWLSQFTPDVDEDYVCESYGS